MRSLRPQSTIELYSTNLVIKLMLLCIGLFVSSFAFSQATVERAVQCSCIDNNAPTGIAQFEEEIVVSSAIGETWYIESVSGFYQLSSPVPPAQQVEFMTGVTGEILAADGAGNYSLQGLLVEDVGYSILLSNGLDSVELSNILCEYPASPIVGDNAVCGAEVEIYAAANFNTAYTNEWDVLTQGTIIGTNTEETVTVQWDEDATENGVLSLTVSGATGCSSTSFINVEFEGNVTLACNNIVHVSINGECGVDLSVDDVLEDMQYNDDSYEITVTDLESGDVLDLGTPVSEYLFDTLEVSIFHNCSTNSCWGYLIIEDKQIPQLVCVTDTVRCDLDDSPSITGFPVPDDATIIPQGVNEYTVLNFDPCGPAELSYTDAFVAMNCADPFESRVVRTWVITDFSGDTNSCDQIIEKTRTTLDDVVFPGDWDGITNPVLSCEGGYPTLPNGNPDPSFTGFPTEGVCSHIDVSYVDLISEVCGATYKVVRKFTAFDECTGGSIQENQLIKIEDSEAPEFNCPSNLDFYITETTECTADITTPAATNVVDCSDVTFEAEIVKINSAGNIAGLIAAMSPVSGGFFASDREIGRHRVTYTATDACGLESSCTFIIEIFDNTPPVAVCDLNTTIAIDTEGTAVVPVSTFDNGSHDNCEIASILVSRGPNSCGASSGFAESITLCCADVNTEVMVTLQVTDASGNINTCMVMVMVQDKKLPVLTCPPNMTISCIDDIDDLSAYGEATVTDNCSATIEEVASININSCSVGSISRTFTATDAGGNMVSCTQLITVQDPDPLTYGLITWPANYSTNNCVSPDLHPDDLPFNNAYPQIGTNQCSNIVVDFEDKTYTNVNSIACKTIHRTWIVKDLCSTTNPDGFEFLQFLEVIDNQAPQFEECSNKVLTGTFDEDCSYAISYSKTASDQCTSPEFLSFSYVVDFYNDGNTDLAASDSLIEESFPVGQHRVEWTVEDDCGNPTSCVEFITIDDLKQPTPYCLGGISTVLMPSTGTIGIWANDFDLGSTDDCTMQQDLEFSFSENKANTGRTFTCADLDGEIEKIIELQVYVHDEAGNFDFCTSYIRLRDNNNTCDTTTTIMSLSGLVFTEDQKSMEFVDMELMDLNAGEPSYQTTSETGIYAFQDLETMVEYTITPSYDDANYHNGITTLDILLIQKHILGLATLSSPYKILAADVDNNEKINGLDIIQIRKLLLGVYDEFPSGKNWLFVDGSQEFEDNFKPWPYNESVNFVADQSYGDVNFIMVKSGDVNLSRTTNLVENELVTRTEPLELEYEWTEVDGQHLWSLYASEDALVNGFQIELEVQDIENFERMNSALDIAENAVFVEDNVIRVSWSGASAQRVDGALLELNFGAVTPIQIAEEGRFNSEIYLATQGTIEVKEISLRGEEIEPEVYTTRVHQNRPNPFYDRTEIVVELALADNLKLEIHDMNGRLMMTKTMSLEAGVHSLWLNNNEVGGSSEGGVYVYTVSGTFGQISKRMIIIQ